MINQNYHAAFYYWNLFTLATLKEKKYLDYLSFPKNIAEELIGFASQLKNIRLAATITFFKTLPDVLCNITSEFLTYQDGIQLSQSNKEIYNKIPMSNKNNLDIKTWKSVDRWKGKVIGDEDEILEAIYVLRALEAVNGFSVDPTEKEIQHLIYEISNQQLNFTLEQAKYSFW